MRSPSWSRCLSACAFLALVAISVMPMWAQEGRQISGLTHDWSNRHIIYTNNSTSARKEFAASRDPRALSAYLQRGIIPRDPIWWPGVHRIGLLREDWAFSMGTPNSSTPIAPNQYPATFVKNFTFGGAFTTPSCANDFLALPVNIVGGGTANLIGLNNLYSINDTSGFCATTGPTVLFAYQTGSGGGANATSVELSLDGTKIVWVENSNPPKVHVVAWKNEGTVAAPIDLTTRPAASAPVAGSGTVATVTLSSSTSVTNSSPFVDYDHDLAYVDDDSGNLYRIENVFCTTAACIASPVAPSLDAAWTTNPVNLGSTKLTSPVADAVTGYIYVGGANGNLYVRKSSDGSSVSGSPIAIGNGNQGGVADTPLVDGIGANGYTLVYAFTGDDTGVTGGLSTAVIAQLQVNQGTGALGTVTRGSIGQPNEQPIYSGTPNNAYYTGVGTPIFYVCGITPSSTVDADLYEVPFGVNKIIGTPADLGPIGGGNQACSPLSEFYNGTNDRLFVTFPVTAVVEDFNINSTLPDDFCPNGPTCLQWANNSGSTGGLIIDSNYNPTGTSTANIYFGDVGAGNPNDGTCWTGTTGATALALSGTSTKTSGATFATGSFTTAANHGLAIGEMVAIAGNTSSPVNENCTVATTPSPTTFTCTYADNTAGSGTGGNVQLGTCTFKLTQESLE